MSGFKRIEIGLNDGSKIVIYSTLAGSLVKALVDTYLETRKGDAKVNIKKIVAAINDSSPFMGATIAYTEKQYKQKQRREAPK